MSRDRKTVDASTEDEIVEEAAADAVSLLELMIEEHDAHPSPIGTAADPERIVLTAEKEIVLRCGKASITLTREGKILIRGAYVLSRSSGNNRIQGGSVQIN